MISPDDRQALVARISRAVAAVERVNAVYASVAGPLGLTPEGALWGAVSALADMVIAGIDDDFGGPDEGWVNWYVWENDCGAKAMEAGFDGEMRPIASVEDLVWVMLGALGDSDGELTRADDQEQAA